MFSQRKGLLSECIGALPINTIQISILFAQEKKEDLFWMTLFAPDILLTSLAGLQNLMVQKSIYLMQHRQQVNFMRHIQILSAGSWIPLVVSA